MHTEMMTSRIKAVEYASHCPPELKTPIASLIYAGLLLLFFLFLFLFLSFSFSSFFSLSLFLSLFLFIFFLSFAILFPVSNF